MHPDDGTFQTISDRSFFFQCGQGSVSREDPVSGMRSSTRDGSLSSSIRSECTMQPAEIER